jgi:hypothetical protein
VLVGQPFDHAKVRIQQPHSSYRGMLDALRTIAAKEVSPALSGFSLQRSSQRGVEGYHSDPKSAGCLSAFSKDMDVYVVCKQ